MRTIACMWAVPWKGGGTAARLKGEGLGTDHATWLIGRRCVARGPYWVRVWRLLRSVCCMVPVGRWGLAGAARGSTERSHAPVRAYPCLCRRTTGACTGDEGAVRVHCRPDGGIRCSVCACEVSGRYRYGDVGTCGSVSPRPAGATGAGVRQFRSACARGGRRWGPCGGPVGVVWACAAPAMHESHRRPTLRTHVRTSVALTFTPCGLAKLDFPSSRTLGSSARESEHSRFSCRFVALLSIRSLRAPCGAATQQIAPPTRAPADRGPTDARHSRRALARTHQGRRAATETPQLQRLLFT